MVWPEEGGGGEIDKKVAPSNLFERLCAWDDAEYIICCGTKDGPDDQDTDGIVDGHAYTVLAVSHDIEGSGVNLVKVRNPWGHGEFKSGRFDDDGPGWSEYPDVKEHCKPVQANDGIFWLEEHEFFEYFKAIYLCAQNMGKAYPGQRRESRSDL